MAVQADMYCCRTPAAVTVIFLVHNNERHVKHEVYIVY